MKLLYAEDEKSMAEAVAEILEYHNYTVDVVYNGEDALDYAVNGQYDGIILDIMMPKKSGIEVLETLRKEGVNTPVLLLTAKAEVEDRIAGLDAGADDYLPKPFAGGELIARVRAMLRRREGYTPDILTLGNITLNRRNFELTCTDKSDSSSEPTVLSKLEYLMMELLMINQGIYISTEDILVKVWGYDTDAEIGIVWVYISNLRKRLAAIGANVEIKAKRNIGYTLEVTV